ncbi:hypothetical protein [Paracoccus lutimaris]|uniref:Secreted protein n=1 Tax=Paracoccus lutimaris TaxID=1490030 RepID=A0A368YEV0_9RHOB|nr:hypothetical protein [Paracoccus lutimaris]RCW78675.1 hypothetical protein DFP89_13317 [Paracoccus lutimaris]
MFIQLVILACLADGATCRDFPLLYDAREVSLLTCMTAAQPEIARWQSGHPQWQPRKWRCEAVDPAQRSL